MIDAACMTLPGGSDDGKNNLGVTKDKNGNPLPKVDVGAIKEFLKENLIKSGVS